MCHSETRLCTLELSGSLDYKIAMLALNRLPKQIIYRHPEKKKNDHRFQASLTRMLEINE